MSREWKPGDVARIKGNGMDAVAIRTAIGGWAWVDGTGKNPIHGASFCHGSGVDGIERTARPLVVIDPDDREQVERLADLFGVFPDTAAYYLREFANPTPPKPDEPQGLGAVVEDEGGKRWVRAGKSHSGRFTDNWRCVDGEHVGYWANWSNLTAIRVLSEGVTS